MRTDSNDYVNKQDQLLNGLLGLNGEAGEAIDIYKKWKFQGHMLDKEKLIEELGDALWYIALSAKGLGVSLNEVARKNIDKLRKRYPEGFSTEDSIERRDHDPNGEPDMPEVRDES
jgi:NTP pyrophosphatase (non-canonical NTP hydrolase)